MTLQTYKPSSHQLHTTHSLQRKKNVTPRVLPPSPVLNRHYRDSGGFLRFFRDDGGPDLVPPLVCCKELVVVLSQSFRLSLLLNLLSTSLRRCVKNRQRFGPDCSSLHFNYNIILWNRLYFPLMIKIHRVLSFGSEEWMKAKC